MGTNDSIAVNQTLFPKLRYDTLRDVTPIVKAGSAPNVLAVHPSVPAKKTKEFVESGSIKSWQKRTTT